MSVSLYALAAGLPFLSFLLGAVPFSFLIGKAAGLDIREHGSGNPGASNVYRVVGRPQGALAFILDTGKGAVPAFAAGMLYDHLVPGSFLLPRVWYIILCGFASAVGHVWTPFLGFRGGKGVATLLGFFAVLFPKGLAVTLVLAVVLILVTRIFSVGSLAGAVVLPLSYFYFSPEPFSAEEWPVLAITLIASALVFYRHRENIARLVRGKEFGTRGQ